MRTKKGRETRQK